MGAQTIHLSAAHQVNRGTGPNGPIKIAVLDTGVDATHPALAGHLLPGFDFVDNDNDPSEVGSLQTGPWGHGTHVAGLIALIAPEAKIIPIRVLDQHGVGNVWVIAEALRFAVDPDNDPSTNDGADVINLSLATLRHTKLLSSVLSRVCDDAPAPGEDDFPATANPNLVVVAAAGNDADSTQHFPAAENVKGLIAVSASNSQDRLAGFSTRGSWVNVAAPGESILSTVPNGQFGTWSGTSMAAPIVAGEAALVRAAFPFLSNRKIVDHIEREASRLDGPNPQKRIDVGRTLTTTPELELDSTLQVSASSRVFSEGPASVQIDVMRTGDASAAAAVDYATSDFAGMNNCNVVGGEASARCDYLSTAGTLHFAPGGGCRGLSWSPLLMMHTPKARKLLCQPEQCSRANFGLLSTATVTIHDNDATNGPNPIDEASAFVRQHYIDFLNREPDSAGLAFWTNEITSCGSNQACIENKRVNVSAAFFSFDRISGDWLPCLS